MKRWKQGDKIEYEIGVYCTETGESIVGVMPSPETLIKNTKAAFAAVGIKVSIKEKVNGTAAM